MKGRSVQSHEAKRPRAPEVTQRERDDAVWRALADRNRREILDLLGGEPRTTGGLVDSFPHLSRTAVMKHLDVLERADLLIVRREGRVRWNQLNPIPIEQIHERWVAPHVRRMASALLRLKGQVEKKAAQKTRTKINPRRKR